MEEEKRDGKKGQKPGGKPHTGMIEFKYSKVFEDYERAKTKIPMDLALFKKQNPKKESIQVVLHNIHDGQAYRDVNIESFIMRVGNFGTPAPVNLSSLTAMSQFGDGDNLPFITGLQRSNTELSLLRSNTVSRASRFTKTVTENESKPSSSSIKLPGIKSNFLNKKKNKVLEISKSGKNTVNPKLKSSSAGKRSNALIGV